MVKYLFIEFASLFYQLLHMKIVIILMHDIIFIYTCILGNLIFKYNINYFSFAFIKSFRNGKSLYFKYSNFNSIFWLTKKSFLTTGKQELHLVIKDILGQFPKPFSSLQLQISTKLLKDQSASIYV